jgi:hypothetical protein
MPRRRTARTSPLAQAVPSGDSLQIQRSRSRLQGSEDEEDFDMNIPGSDEDDDPPVRSRTMPGTSQTQVNDPGVPEPKKVTDIKYFFKKDKFAECKICL